MFEYAIDAGAGSFGYRLRARRRGAPFILLSKALFGSAREAMYTRLAMKPDEDMLAFVEELLEDEDGEPRGMLPRVRALEIQIEGMLFRDPEDPEDPETNLPSKEELTVGLIGLLRHLSPGLHELCLAVRIDDLDSLIMADRVMAMVANAGEIWAIPALHKVSLELSMSPGFYSPAAVRPLMRSTLTHVLAICGRAVDLRLDFSGLLGVEDMFARTEPLVVPGLALRRLSTIRVPFWAIAAILAANEAPLAHLTLGGSMDRDAYEPSLSGITFVTLETMLFHGAVAWHSLPDLRELEVLHLYASIDALPSGLEALHLRIYRINELDRLAFWLAQPATLPELRRLRITLRRDFDGWVASADYLASVVEACRARSIALEAVDADGQSMLSGQS